MKRRRRLALTVLAGGMALAVAGLVFVLPFVQEEYRRRELWADLVPPPQPDDEWRARRDAAVTALLADETRRRWALARLAGTDPPDVDPRWNADSDILAHFGGMAGDRPLHLRRRRVRRGGEPSPAPGIAEDGRRRLALRAWCLDQVPGAAAAGVARWLVQASLDRDTLTVPAAEDSAAMTAEPGRARVDRTPPSGRVGRLEIIALHPPGVMPLPEAEGLDPREVSITLTTADDTWGTRWVLILSEEAGERAGPLHLEWTRVGDRAPRWMWPADGGGDTYVGMLTRTLDVPAPPALPEATRLPPIHSGR